MGGGASVMQVDDAIILGKFVAASGEEVVIHKSKVRRLA
jgi:aspartate 1-decarboxylase